jgi:hypothetical protein
LLTGQYTARHCVYNNEDRSLLSHLLPTFPQELQQSGYTTERTAAESVGLRDGSTHGSCARVHSGTAGGAAALLPVPGTQSRASGRHSA